MVGILIVDDSSLLRSMLTTALGRHSGLKVVGECADGAEVPAAARLLRPDVVLMDLHMPVTCGLQATRNLLAQQPAARVIIFTGSTTTNTIGEAAQAGAVGYLCKGADLEQLVKAIRVVAEGGTAWPS